HAAPAGVPAVIDAAGAVLAEVPGIDVDYLQVRDNTLGPAPDHGPARLLVAAKVGATRLLDNVAITIGVPAGTGISAKVPVGSHGCHELSGRN
ncbi:MAG TPA: pantoate--beta-alanine ligase, partial [Mycobacterium sp.]|nr:pantoate--beta-alanine ligase [Mycobacterium sp.]